MIALLLLRIRRHILLADVANAPGLIADHQRRLDRLKLQHEDRQSELRRVEARIDLLERPRPLINQALKRRSA